MSPSAHLAPEDSTNQRTTLEAWLIANFAEDCRPTINTARKWAKTDRLDPPATKCGRAYFVHPCARYTEKPRTAKPRLIDRIRAAETTKP